MQGSTARSNPFLVVPNNGGSVVSFRILPVEKKLYEKTG
jgi:hypothetical protein